MATALMIQGPTILDDLTRRELVLGGVALAALLAGCGSGSEDEATTSFRRSLAGKEGTATIQAQPTRVVTVGFQRDTDTVLALGVIPVGMVRHASFDSGMAPWVEAALGDARPEIFDGATGLPFETIARLRPDLIVATDDYSLATNYPSLAEIAPTLSYLGGVESDTWQQRTAHVGRALGREEKADELILDIERQIMRAAASNPTFEGKTFSRFYAFEGEVRAITGSDASVTLLEQLGLTVSPEVAALAQNDTPGRASVSLENLEVLDSADVMLASFSAESDRTFFESSPLFPRLDAVRNGGYVVLDHSVALALGFPSALSIPYGLDRTVAAIADALT